MSRFEHLKNAAVIGAYVVWMLGSIFWLLFMGDHATRDLCYDRADEHFRMAREADSDGERMAHESAGFHWREAGDTGPRTCQKTIDAVDGVGSISSYQPQRNSIPGAAGGQ